MGSLHDRVARFLQRFFDWFDGKKGAPTHGGAGELLCDDCKYNYGNVCTRPERPNATRCPDFKRR